MGRLFCLQQAGDGCAVGKLAASSNHFSLPQAVRYIPRFAASSPAHSAHACLQQTSLAASGQVACTKQAVDVRLEGLLQAVGEVPRVDVTGLQQAPRPLCPPLLAANLLPFAANTVSLPLNCA